MKIKSCHLIVAIATIIMMGSCSMYQPQLAPLPLLQEKGELQIQPSVLITPAPHIVFGLSAAYAPINHLGVQLHGNALGDSNSFIEGAVGYFQKVGDTRGVLEIYAGLGYGNSDKSGFKNSDSGKKDHYYGFYRMAFGQINYGFRGLGKCDLGFGLRMGAMYPNFTNNDQLLGRKVNYNTDPSMFIEPTLMFRVGGEMVKFTLEIGYSHIFQQPYEDTGLLTFTYQPISLSAGVTIFIQ